VKAQKEKDRGVIYISHRFTEIAAICDRAAVLRDGETVGTVDIVPGIEERVVEMMLGTTARASGAAVARRAVPAAAVPRLRVRGLGDGRKLADVSFDLHKGEVLGVVALEGQGQDELFEVLAGFERPARGTIEVDGAPVRLSHPADAIGLGLTLVPGDRAHALLMQRSVRENIALPFSARVGAWGPIDMGREKARVDEAVARLQIDTRAMGEVRRLSGGNQQKVTIGRWIATGVETLLLFDPTRGIDIRTKRQIYPLLRELAEQGASVLLYTSELAEVQLACDRAIVIFGGRVVDVIDAADADEPRLMRAAYGLTERDRAGAPA
jgi:ribose transport system ATP-binding protein